MVYSNVDLLLAISFLHSICGGILLTYLPRHIKKSGGNQVLLGILQSMAYICQKLVNDVLALLPGGRVHALTFSMYCCFIYALILVFYNTIQACFIMRCLYGLTVNVVNICKELIERIEPEHKQIKIFNLIDLWKTFGTLIGFIVGGYVYECNRNYSSNAMISSCLLVVCIFLLANVDIDDSKDPNQNSQLSQIPIVCYEKLKRLKETDFRQKSFGFTLKSLYTFAFAIFINRFIYILLHSYHGMSATFLCYLLSYDVMVALLCNCVVPFIRTKVNNDKILFKCNIVIGGCLIIGLFYAPTWQCYLILYAILMLSYTLVNSLFRDDVLNLKSDEDVNEADNTLTVGINFFSPSFSGLIVQLFGVRGVKIAILVPVIVYLHIVTQRDLRTRREEDGEEDTHER